MMSYISIVLPFHAQSVRSFTDLRATVSSVVKGSEKTGLDAEIVIVNWNDIHEETAFKNLLGLSGSEKTPVKLVTVTPEMHSSFPNSKLIPFFSAKARNTGIRRADGDFILSSNPGIIFPLSVLSILAEKKLEKNKLYRAERKDVLWDKFPLDGTLESQEKFLNDDSNTVRVVKAEGTFNCINKRFKKINVTPGMEALFGNSCSDFQLMAKEHFEYLCGFAELNLADRFLDTLFEYTAHYSGFTEETLTQEIFRLDKFDYTVPEYRTKDKIYLESNDIPFMKPDQWRAFAERVRAERKPVIFNNENWGLIKADLPELLICGD